MRVLGVLFYAGILIFIGVILVVFSVMIGFPKFQPQAVEYVNSTILYLEGSLYAKLVLGLCGLLLVLISYSFAQLILGRFQREKTIAFATSSGEVTIALSAIEDLIRKLAGVIPEIKELRPDVIATKKGILVDLRVVLRSEANIPDLTSRLQDITRAKIQEVLGVEEQIIVKIHVAKIIGIDEKRKRESEKDEPTIPFSGYGRA